MLARLPKHYYHNQTLLYEGIYARLLKLIPELTALTQETSLSLDIPTELTFKVIEQHRYTTIVALQIHLTGDSSTVPLPDIKMGIRCYHDARVAEVLSYQNASHLQPEYDYPNTQMYLPDEKHQINMLLYEWLDYGMRHVLETVPSNT